MKYVLPFIVALLGIANGQTSERACCSLKAAQIAEDPGIIKITIKNIGERPLPLFMGETLRSFEFTAKSSNGTEPARTGLGESIRRGNKPAMMNVLMSPERRVLQPGESVDQTLELGLIWTLSEGEYRIGISRVIVVEGRVYRLSTEITVLIPHRYFSDKACTAEAQAKIAAQRRTGPLRGEEDAPQKSNELETALSKHIEILSRATTHALINAFEEALEGAHIPGGIVLTNEGAIGLALVCVAKGESVRDTLEEIQAAGPDLVLDGSAPVVNIVDRRASNFLETRIAKVVIPSPLFAIHDAIATLLEAPEVQSRREELALKEEGPMRAPSMSRLSERAQQEGPIILENVTVRQALNVIVQRVGNGIWIYNEWKTGSDRRAFTINVMFSSRAAQK